MDRNAFCLARTVWAREYAAVAWGVGCAKVLSDSWSRVLT